MPKLKGAIARCSKGQLGIILEDLPTKVTYPNGEQELAYVGVHIGPSRIGELWFSRQPQVERFVSSGGFRALMYLINKARALKSLPIKPVSVY